MITRRRMFVSLALGGCIVAAPALAEADKTLHLGTIAPGPPLTPDSPFGKILIGALADLGYAPGLATGLAESWAHPGGVVTGISDLATTLTVKRLELLKAFSPQMKRVAMLWNADDRAMTLRYETSAATAQTQGLVVEPLGAQASQLFPKPLAPVISRLRRSAIQSQAASLRNSARSSPRGL